MRWSPNVIQWYKPIIAVCCCYPHQSWMPQDVLSLEGSVLGNMQAAFIFIVALNIRSLLSKLVPGRTSHKIGHTHTERVIVFFRLGHAFFLAPHFWLTHLKNSPVFDYYLARHGKQMEWDTCIAYPISRLQFITAVSWLTIFGSFFSDWCDKS